MNGLTFKTAVIIFSFLLTMFSVSLALATNNQSDKTKIYRSKLGCMSCHQGGSMSEDSPLKENDHGSERLNQAH